MVSIFAIRELATLMSFSIAADTMKMDKKKYTVLKSFLEKRL
jgi:hypothetical protein